MRVLLVLVGILRLRLSSWILLDWLGLSLIISRILLVLIRILRLLLLLSWQLLWRLSCLIIGVCWILWLLVNWINSRWRVFIWISHSTSIWIFLLMLLMLIFLFMFTMVLAFMMVCVMIILSWGCWLRSILLLLAYWLGVMSTTYWLNSHLIILSYHLCPTFYAWIGILIVIVASHIVWIAIFELLVFSIVIWVWIVVSIILVLSYLLFGPIGLFPRELRFIIHLWNLLLWILTSLVVVIRNWLDTWILIVCILYAIIWDTILTHTRIVLIVNCRLQVLAHEILVSGLVIICRNMGSILNLLIHLFPLITIILYSIKYWGVYNHFSLFI